MCDVEYNFQLIKVKNYDNFRIELFSELSYSTWNFFDCEGIFRFNLICLYCVMMTNSKTKKKRRKSKISFEYSLLIICLNFENCEIILNCKLFFSSKRRAIKNERRNPKITSTIQNDRWPYVQNQLILKCLGLL